MLAAFFREGLESMIHLGLVGRASPATQLQTVSGANDDWRVLRQFTLFRAERRTGGYRPVCISIAALRGLPLAALTGNQGFLDSRLTSSSTCWACEPVLTSG